MRDQKIILFGAGAQFSTAVLGHLLANGLKPVALVLPEFAPAAVKSANELQVDVARQENQFVLLANRLSIPLLYLPELSQIVQVNKISAFNAEFFLIACWPYLISPEIANTPTRAALNIHPSLLPKYRGADPITAQIYQREKNLGVSLHLLSEEFDKGDIISQASLNVRHESPGYDLIETEAARVGVDLFMKAINDFGGPEWRPVCQSF